MAPPKEKKKKYSRGLDSSTVSPPISSAQPNVKRNQRRGRPADSNSRSRTANETEAIQDSISRSSNPENGYETSLKDTPSTSSSLLTDHRIPHPQSSTSEFTSSHGTNASSPYSRSKRGQRSEYEDELSVKRQGVNHNSGRSTTIKENDFDRMSTALDVAVADSPRVQTSAPRPLNLMDMPVDIPLNIFQNCAINYEDEVWEKSADGEELLQKFPKGNAQRNELQLLLVSSQINGEFTMMLYKDF